MNAVHDIMSVSEWEQAKPAHDINKQQKGRYLTMICPKCGSNNVTVQTVSETTTTGKTKGFGWIKSCIGFLLFSVPGILCGLCGMGKGKTRTTTKMKAMHICQNCGKQF